jgi:hypothetical protein
MYVPAKLLPDFRPQYSIFGFTPQFNVDNENRIIIQSILYSLQGKDVCGGKMVDISNIHMLKDPLRSQYGILRYAREPICDLMQKLI